MDDIVVDGGIKERLEALAGERRDLLVIGGIVVVVVLGTLMLWTRGAPARIAPPARIDAASPSPTPAGSMLVHVAGAVRRPGLYEFTGEPRIADAIDAARGPKRNADLDALNLAEPLADGMKIYVPRRGEASEIAVGASPSAAPSLIDLNAADQAALETIPGIGPVRAAAILQHRTEIGGFTAIEQLLDVNGIGPATFEAIRPYVTL